MFHLLTGRLLAVRIWLLLCASALILTGLATLYAIGHPADTSGAVKLDKVSGLFQRQVWFVLVGLGGFVAVNWVNYRDIGQISGWLLAAVMVLLAILVVSKIAGTFGRQLPFAPQSNNVYQWIVIKVGNRSLTLQPSEFCKLAYVVTLAWYLRYRSNYRNLESLVGPFVLTLLPVALILAEPDLGTVILLMGILFLMLFMAGARLKHLGAILLMALVLSPLLWYEMKQTQRMRVAAVLLQNDGIRERIEQSPTLGRILVGKPFTTRDWMNTGGYQLERSKNAIASGSRPAMGSDKVHSSSMTS